MPKTINTPENHRTIRLYKTVTLLSMAAIVAAIPFAAHVFEINRDLFDWGEVVAQSAMRTGDVAVSSKVGW
ncbi:hypothetical protein [Acetobacter orientalis]|uniref:Uncharacterized protein n=1 Tax=Acetobacter orientalis TaxID=146474 RepID=A0A251ZX71_9PROT|nr:hypothetical protein [Acetobacter orientalis]OUI79242.1 hypothetical protein HK12_00270 [Acetobacter orientalis]